MFYTKTTRGPFFYRTMVGSHVKKALNTFTSFFITVQVKQKEIRVLEYCPTWAMVAGYFTKPLQGSLFRKFRNMILGIVEEDIETYKENSK